MGECISPICLQQEAIDDSAVFVQLPPKACVLLSGSLDIQLAKRRRVESYCVLKRQRTRARAFLYTQRAVNATLHIVIHIMFIESLDKEREETLTAQVQCVAVGC